MNKKVVVRSRNGLVDIAPIFYPGRAGLIPGPDPTNIIKRYPLMEKLFILYYN